jgi:phosphonate transport system ATP-binding protein
VAEKGTESLILDMRCKGVKYGERTVLQPFHLRITEGQHIAVLGASGAGKSTLLKVIFDHFNAASQKTALIPQELGLVENLSVFHNVYIGRLDQLSTFSNLINLVSPNRCAKKEINAILGKLLLSNKLLTLCGELSGGEQQRIAISRAIFRQAPVLIADEPVANLDQSQADIALKLMITHHTSSILALHNTDQALRYCERIIGIANGVIILDAPTAQLSSQDLADIYKTLDIQ